MPKKCIFDGKLWFKRLFSKKVHVLIYFTGKLILLRYSLARLVIEVSHDKNFALKLDQNIIHESDANQHMLSILVQVFSKVMTKISIMC